MVKNVGQIRHGTTLARPVLNVKHDIGVSGPEQ